MGKLKIEVGDTESCLMLADALNRYIKNLPDKKAKSLRSALFRFVVPGLGGVPPKGDRMTPSEIAEASEFIASTPLARLSDALDIQAKEMQRCKIKPDTQRVHRCHLKAFISWCKEQGWLTEPEALKQSEPYRFHRPDTQTKQKRYRKLNSKYILKDSDISDKLAIQLREYEAFSRFTLKKRDISIQKFDIPCIKRVLGWLHSHKGIANEELSLERIVPIVKMQFEFSDFGSFEKYAVAKVEAESQSIKEGQKADALMHEYFAFCNCSANSFSRILTTVISVAKFLYKDEIAPHQSDGVIPVIQILRKTRSHFDDLAKHEAPVVPKEERMVSWTQALEVVESLRFEADMEYTDSLIKGQMHKDKRDQTAIASSLYRFLLIAFFVLMPPDRQRTVRELTLGRTLVKGSRDSGVFIPIDRMKNKKDAQWWIHLRPEDYKTGKTHGEQWHLVPNVEFLDGKNFYEYIDRWLDNYRDLFEPVDEIFFPVRHGSRRGKVLNHPTVNATTQAIFRRFTGVPVTPHRLRDMYVTHLKRIGVSEAELEAAALRMHHSPATQSKIYNQQTKDERIAPIYDLHSQIIQSALKANR